MAMRETFSPRSFHLLFVVFALATLTCISTALSTQENPMRLLQTMEDQHKRNMRFTKNQGFDYDQMFSERHSNNKTQPKKHWEAPLEHCSTNPFPKGRKQMMLINETLKQGEYLESKNAKLLLDKTGNLLLISKSNYTLWQSNTTSKVPVFLHFTELGLAIYNTSNHSIWSLKVKVPSTGALTLHDSCDLAIFEQAPFSNELWTTNTGFCLTVHVVPHSHNDVGWILTPERYYDGCFNPNGGVQTIISSVVDALTLKPERKFIQVEMYFFHRWWVRQNNDMRERARKLVKNGQLRFVNSGWSMHDEACVHQESAIANMARGVQFIKEEFGNITNVSIGWHIDPFGHASTTPRLMSQMGFDAFFFWRTDYQHRSQMINTKTVETMWQNSDNMGNTTLMFTSVMPDNYCKGCNNNICSGPLCCVGCPDETLQSWDLELAYAYTNNRPSITELHIRKLFNLNKDVGLKLDSMADTVFNDWIKYARYFRTSNVLIPWGCDFQHVDAIASFDLMDKLMTEMKNKSNAIAGDFSPIYSTPENYIQSVQQEGYIWPVNHHDYFIDSDNAHTYWSGYFSSRMEFKRYERDLMNRRSASEIILSSVKPDRSTFRERWNNIDVLRQSLGVAQHHDAITGTSRQSVLNQYKYLLTEGMHAADAAMGSILEETTGLQRIVTCPLANLSTCISTEGLVNGGNVSVLVYNPLQQEVDHIAVIPVPTNKLKVDSFPGMNSSNPFVEGQVQDTWSLTRTNDPGTSGAKPMNYEVLLRFKLAPLSTSLLILRQNDSGSNIPYVVQYDSDTLDMKNEFISAQANGDFSLIGITNLKTQVNTKVEMNYLSYCPMPHHNTNGPYSNDWNQGSGAYIFRPCEHNAVPSPFSTIYKSTSIYGPLCIELRSIVSHKQNIHQTLRLCKGQPYLTIISGIGEIDPEDSGKEIVLRIKTDLDTKGTYYTDSEGLEMQKRIRDHRPNYNYTVTEPIAANFFPVNQIAMIKSEGVSHNKKPNAALALVTDSSRAVASINDAEIEMLMIRRVLYDDDKGVAQALNESIRIISSTLLIFDTNNNTMSIARMAARTHAHPPLLFYSPQTGLHLHSPPASGHNMPSLPPQVHLHTRDMLDEHTMLVRLQHIFDRGESQKYSVPVTVDLKSVLPKTTKDGAATIEEIEETDLNGIIPLKQVNEKRKQFNACNHQTGKHFKGPTPFTSSITKTTMIKLEPMDIRTYRIKIRWGKNHVPGTCVDIFINEDHE